MEEEEQDKIDPEYLKGFNEGYMLAHHNPDLIRKLANISSEVSRVVGFKAGLEQFQAEQIQIQQIGEPELNQPESQAQTASDKTDVFDQLYRQQTKAEDLDQKIQPPTAVQQKSEERDDLFTQLKKKQDQDHKGHDIEP